MAATNRNYKLQNNLHNLLNFLSFGSIMEKNVFRATNRKFPFQIFHNVPILSPLLTFPWEVGATPTPSLTNPATPTVAKIYWREVAIRDISYGYSHVLGTAVAQWLRCCATNRKVAGSIPANISVFFIDMKSFRSHYVSGVDSASNRNEYQEYFLGVKAAGA